MTPNNEQHFIDRLKKHPNLFDRMEALLNVVENVAGDCTKADDAGQYVIKELRNQRGAVLPLLH